MPWVSLVDFSQINLQINQSKSFIVFKHSTRCSISTVAKNRLECGLDIKDITLFYLDILSYRTLSNELAIFFKVTHESPQILIIKDGICIYNASHNGININDIKTIV